MPCSAVHLVRSTCNDGVISLIWQPRAHHLVRLYTCTAVNCAVCRPIDQQIVGKKLGNIARTPKYSELTPIRLELYAAAFTTPVANILELKSGNSLTAEHFGSTSGATFIEVPHQICTLIAGGVYHPIRLIAKYLNYPMTVFAVNGPSKCSETSVDF